MNLHRHLRGASLTVRGVAFASFGTAAVTAALLYGHRDLLRVGLLLASVPLISGIVLLRIRPQLAAVRAVSPPQVAVGQEAAVTIRITNLSPSRAGTLLIEDSVPLVLGARPRFLLTELGPRDSGPSSMQEIAYTVRSSSRGRFPVGPLVLRVSDPLGMWELRRGFAIEDDLLVTPRTVPLPDSAPRGVSLGGIRSARLATAGEDDIGVREYRHGDPVHRVHWRATARYGEVMVRREEQPERLTATLLLDTRPEGYTRSRRSSFEEAVSIVASAAEALVQRGYHVRVLTTCDPTPLVDGSDRHPQRALQRVREQLAEVELCRHPRAAADASGRDHGACTLPAVPPPGTAGLVLAVLGGRLASTPGVESAGEDLGVSDEVAALLAPWRSSATAAVAVVVTGQTRASRHPTESDCDSDGEQRLRSARWSVARVTAADDFPRVWQAATVAAGPHAGAVA